MDITDDNVDFMQSIIQPILESNIDGISEYDLISQLKDSLYDDGAGNIFSDSSQLFAIHFLLFHCLHKLRIKLNSEKRAFLDITPLSIRILSYEACNSNELASPDKMAQYYLDTDNLINTSQQDIDEMLGAFWVKFMNPEEKEQAMKTLGVTEPFDQKTIKSTYKKLTMKHHPDRGGNKQRIQDINNAMDILKRYL